MDNKFTKPLTKTKITSKFGNRTNPITKVIEFHNGVDLSAVVGTPIYAPADSIVTAKYNDAKGGNQLIIQHNDYKFGFAHLQSYAPGIEINKKIQKGDIIAYTGQSGMTTGGHLHFVVRFKNIPENPELFFKF